MDATTVSAKRKSHASSLYHDEAWLFYIQRPESRITLFFSIFCPAAQEPSELL